MTVTTPRIGDGYRLRVTVAVPGEEFDLEVPGDEAIVAWLPDVIDILLAHGILIDIDPSWGWYRMTGARLAEAASLRAQGVVSGQRLWFGVAPESRIQLLTDGYGRQKRDVETRQALTSRILGAAAVAIAIAVHLAVLVSSPSTAIVAVAAAFLVAQFALFRGLSSSKGFLARVNRAEWEVFAATVFVSAALVGIELGRVSSVPAMLGASMLVGIAGVVSLLSGIPRRWQAVFWSTLAVLGLIGAAAAAAIGSGAGFGVGLPALGALPAMSAPSVVIAVAVLLAATSHRVARGVSLLPGVREHNTADYKTREQRTGALPASADGTASARIAEQLIVGPQRDIGRARLIQGAIACAALVVVVAGAVTTPSSALSLAYDLVCLFAAASCAWTASYDGRAIVVASALGAAAYLIFVGATALPVRCAFLAIVALVSLGLSVDAARGASDHPTLTATLVRLRTFTLIVVFALLAAELNGWALAWQLGAQLGRRVF